MTRTIKELVRDQIDHAAFNGHTLNPECQGVAPGAPPIPAVRVDYLEAAIGDAVDQPDERPEYEDRIKAAMIAVYAKTPLSKTFHFDKLPPAVQTELRDITVAAVHAYLAA